MTFYMKFAFLLIEENSPEPDPSTNVKNEMPDFGTSPHETEEMVSKLGKLLMAKIRAHSSFEPDLLTTEEILKRDSKPLAPIMYRIATEKFINTSKAKFKIIECRNSTKLVTDWKPRVPDLLMSSGHQVVVVELKELFSTCNDFAYAILRKVKYNWRIRLPISFFYPDDVCSVQSTSDGNLLLVTPSMPDSEVKLPDGIKKTLQYNILMMLRASCESAMENHLLMRDLGVGTFDMTLDGVASIRDVYRSLQERVRDGKGFSLGTTPIHDSELYMLSPAGDTIMAAEALLSEFKNETKTTGNGSGELVPNYEEIANAQGDSCQRARRDLDDLDKLADFVSKVTESGSNLPSQTIDPDMLTESRN